jgi:uncharacterized protein
MKFSIKPYTLDKADAENQRKKMAIFKDATKTPKALWLTYITTFGLTPNAYAQSLVHQSLTMDALFQNK